MWTLREFFHRVVTVSKNNFSPRTLIQLEIYFSPLFNSFLFFIGDTSNSFRFLRNGVRFYLLSFRISNTAVLCNLSGTRGQTGKLRESKRRCSRRHAILYLQGNRAQLLVRTSIECFCIVWKGDHAHMNDRSDVRLTFNNEIALVVATR